MSVAIQNILQDVSIDRINQIVVVRLDPLKNEYLKQRDEIVAFVGGNGSAEINMLDGLWCSVKPQNGYLNFHVELKR